MGANTSAVSKMVDVDLSVMVIVGTFGVSIAEMIVYPFNWHFLLILSTSDTLS